MLRPPYMLRLFSLLMLTLLMLTLLFAIGSSGAARAAGQTCFPETSFCIDGRFRDYWEQNGGLPVFGFPIGPAQTEVSRETGQSYLTQWFERNRFELHPESAAPYDVLLGRLSDDILRRQGIDWQLQPREAGPQDGCLWFEQSGHNVCDQSSSLGFKSYWQSHGLRDAQLSAYGRSLALFGLPLTAARVETNPADGQPYLTQWFERARLEWHPEQEDAYKILLGLLGNQLKPSSAEKIADQVISKPISDQHTLYWFGQRDGLSGLYSKDLPSGPNIALSGQPDTYVMPAASNNQVVWVERSPDGQRQYVKLSMNFNRLGPLQHILLESGGTVTSSIGYIALEGNLLYYSDFTPNHVGLYARNVDSGEETLIDPHGRQPVAADRTLVWSTIVDNGKTGINFRQSWMLHLRNLATGEDRIVTTVADDSGGGQAEYAVAGDNVVWVFSAPNLDNRLFRYQISSGAVGPISPGPSSSPSISGAIVAWATNPFYGYDPMQGWSVQTYDLRTGLVKTVAQGPGPQALRGVAVVGDRVTYTLTDDQQSGLGLYLTASP